MADLSIKKQLDILQERLTAVFQMTRLLKEYYSLSDKLSGTEYSATWYPARKVRNEFARLKFLSSRCGAFVPDDIYLVDIIRGGIEPDDPRLQ